MAVAGDWEGPAYLAGYAPGWEESPRGGLLSERLSWEQSAPRNGLLPGTISLEFFPRSPFSVRTS